MDETPSDSGESPDKVPLVDRVREQLQRSSVLALIAVIVAVLAVQIWLLYL